MRNIRIIFTDFADYEIDQIYSYYEINVSESIAIEILTDIYEALKRLYLFPQMGTVEPILSDMGLEVRYLVVRNHKIVYRIEKDII